MGESWGHGPKLVFMFPSKRRFETDLAVMYDTIGAEATPIASPGGIYGLPIY